VPLYCLLCLFFVRSDYCDSENIRVVVIMTDIHVCRIPECKKLHFGTPSVCLSLFMCPSLKPEPLDGFN
jgi:hypothetical protein